MQEKKLFIISLIFSLFSHSCFCFAQFDGGLEYNSYNTPLQPYFSESTDNWNKSIVYAFYNNQPCADCEQAMSMLYSLYQTQFFGMISYFEINYDVPGEYDFKNAYNLSQPLTIILLKINEGTSIGYRRIDNPQQWVNNPNYFNKEITTQINNLIQY